MVEIRERIRKIDVFNGRDVVRTGEEKRRTPKHGC